MTQIHHVSEIEKRGLIQRVLERLPAVRDQRVLVVGDIGLDEYVNGQVNRISPEAPVPIVDVTDQSQRLGLAANVAQNIVSLGSRVQLLSVVGEDRSGSELQLLLKEAGVGSEHLYFAKDRPTTLKLRVMSGQHHLVRVDFEQRRGLSLEVEDKIKSIAAELMREIDVVILEDYAKGVLSEALIQSIVELAHDAGKKVLADPHRQTALAHYRRVDLLTPNQDEAWHLAKTEPDFLGQDLEALVTVGQKLLAQTESSQLIITLGKRGLALFESDKVSLLPTFAREVFDVTGAGDTFIAALAVGWSSGLSLLEAGVFANFAAGYVVGKVGCVACPLSEVESYMNESIASGPDFSRGLS